MSEKYRLGLAREIIAMKRWGRTNGDIIRCLGISLEYINEVMREPHKHQVEREYTPEIDSINETGGY